MGEQYKVIDMDTSYKWWGQVVRSRKPENRQIIRGLQLFQP